MGKKILIACIVIIIGLLLYYLEITDYRIIFVGLTILFILIIFPNYKNDNDNNFSI